MLNSQSDLSTSSGLPEGSIAHGGNNTTNTANTMLGTLAFATMKLITVQSYSHRIESTEYDASPCVATRVLAENVDLVICIDSTAYGYIINGDSFSNEVGWYVYSSNGQTNTNWHKITAYYKLEDRQFRVEYHSFRVVSNGSAPAPLQSWMLPYSTIPNKYNPDFTTPTFRLYRA